MSQPQRIHHFIHGEFTVHPNARYFDNALPVDGRAIAHIGREGGVHSLEFYTKTRKVCIKL